ncbi:Ig-like domain-containing protein [Bathymodiolus platifrons methanotrophic gill symbiont]|uniref:Ig-like domain-containing protein n=1 Tax=Bathymodiolus platifrons methanotrophic gill symbiont TaxID=113268 RepID=UPI000B41A261|nr:Ig-like domain-containing protein [Bathymodiolus platifrons methanotrophic gill symbiont]
MNGGADVSKFTIDASSGVLTFINPPDYYSPTDANSDNHYQVTVQVDDGKGGTADQEITVQVSLVASATPDSYSVSEDGSLTVPVSGVLANDHDANNDPLTAVLDADVSNGVLTLNPDGSFDYTPTPFFSGTDTFTYHANDGTFDSNIVTVTITVNHINHPPVAHPDAHITHEDIPLIVSVANGVLHNDTDPDVHDTLLATKVTDPGHGSVTLNLDGSLTFTPDANYNGPDSFTYKANDGHTDSNTVTVDIAVAAVNDAPVALPDSYGTQEDTTLKFNAALGVLRNDTAPDGNPVHVRTFSHPANGTLLLNPDGSLEYTPNPNFNGDDSFTYTANDGQLDSAPVQVFIHVSAVNDPPKALPDAYSVHEDTGLSIDVAHGLLHNDSDPEHNILTVKLGNNVANGTLHLKTDGSFDYTPKNNFNGTDSFTYTVNDGALDSTPVTVTLTVDAVNDGPVAVGDAYSVAEDTLLTVPLAKGLLLNDSDPDGDSLLALLVDSPVNGIIQIKLDGTFSYQPNFNFSGADFFTYRVNVGKLDSPTFAIVNITVNHVNKPPLGVADSYKTQEDTALKVIATATTGLLANDLDLDHDILTATAYTLPAHGSLSPGLHGEFIPPIRIITARTALPILPLMDSHSAQ